MSERASEYLTGRDTGDEAAEPPARPTAKQLAEWRRLTEAATPGTFVLVQYDGNLCVNDPDGLTVIDCLEAVDAEFFVAARTAVPTLLAEVDRLRGEWDAMNALLADARGLVEVEREAARIARDKAAYQHKRNLALWPLARAAVAYVEHELADQDGGYWGDLRRTVIDLPADLRAELEAGDADTR